MVSAAFPSGGMSGTMAAAVPTLDVSQPLADTLNPVQLTTASKARVRVRLTEPAPNVIPAAMLSLRFSMPTPVIVKGRPVVPAYVGRPAGSATLHQGVGHARVFTDPDPVWDGTAWQPRPPQKMAGSNMIRWRARDLPDPSLFPNDKYWLGTADAADGTGGYTSDAWQWNSTPGSDFAAAWHSAYPFKPIVRAHTYYGAFGAFLVETQAVHFHSHFVQHMWCDAGALLSPPFSWVVMGVIDDFPHRNSRHYVLDSGSSPLSAVSTTLRQKWLNTGVVGTTQLPTETTLGYRTALQVERGRMRAFTDMAPAGKVGHAPFHHTLKPKMFFMVNNGSHSLVGNYDGQHAKVRTANLANHGLQRLMLLGRCNGVLDQDKASDMAIFEIRAFDKAMSLVDLDKTWQQFVSSFRIFEYGV